MSIIISTYWACEVPVVFSRGYGIDFLELSNSLTVSERLFRYGDYFDASAASGAHLHSPSGLNGIVAIAANATLRRTCVPGCRDQSIIPLRLPMIR